MTPGGCRTNDDTPNQTTADSHGAHLVTGYQLLAENMPSVLKQLRPMDISCDGMLRYLDAHARRSGAASAGRPPRRS